jgi:peptide chain release factor subunit 1
MTDIDELIDRLAAFTPNGAPFTTVYLDTRADEHGRDRFGPFVRKELAARGATFPERSPAREQFERDAQRILEYLQSNARPSANGIAIFACAGADFFEAVQLEAPMEESAVFVAHAPNIYPLARLSDRYKRYAVVVTDTHLARIFVIGLGRIEAAGSIESTKFHRSMAGGWSQARYQRHIDNYHLHHIKEVVDALDRVVREEDVTYIVLAGDEVAVPLIREQLPKPLAERVADVLRLDVTTPDAEVLRQSLDAIRGQDARDDAERVRRMFDAYRSGGLGVVGVEATRAALEQGQVHELLLSASPPPGAADGWAAIADEMVTKARQTSASVSMIEDPALLAEAGGVGGFLRYRIARRAV